MLPLWQVIAHVASQHPLSSWTPIVLLIEVCTIMGRPSDFFLIFPREKVPTGSGESKFFEQCSPSDKQTHFFTLYYYIWMITSLRCVFLKQITFISEFSYYFPYLRLNPLPTEQVSYVYCILFAIRQVSSDIPSMDDRRNIFDAILRVSTHIRLTKRNMHRRNMKIFRVSTPHKEWLKFGISIRDFNILPNPE